MAWMAYRTAAHRWAVGVLAVAVLATGEGLKPKLRVVTFMNRVDRKFAFLQVTAEAHGLYPDVIGYGVDAWWPDGLGIKINSLRHYVLTACADEDIVLFADAFDVMVFGEESEIVSRFEELERREGRSLFFNAEEFCYPRKEGICEEVGAYPGSPHVHWRYLNSGLIAGRGAAFKKMLKDPVPNRIRGGDQAWYQKYFLDHQDETARDTGCELLCAVWNIDHARLNGANRLEVKVTGSTPAMVHLVSLGHWTYWSAEGKSTSVLHDLFRKLYPEVSARLLDRWWIGAQIGSTHDIEVYTDEGLWSLMRTYLCFDCNVRGSREEECKYFDGFLGERCVVFFGMVLLILAFCFALVCQQPRQLLRLAVSVLWKRLPLKIHPKTPEMVV